MAERIASFEQFWPYYLGEHRVPLCRALHFLGTGGFLVVVGWASWLAPLRMGAALLAIIVVGYAARGVEAKRTAFSELLMLVAILAVANPYVLLGSVWAYGWAWVGHFRVEHNRPATFTYPLWSLMADFKMVSLMALGRLRRGDPGPSATFPSET